MEMADTKNLPYDPTAIEKKWQQRWEVEKLYDSNIDLARPKYYALTMLPYPSGDLHIGHWYAIAPSDARARFKRMQGYNVMFPIGFDAFGLPAENAAIQRNIHPREWTYRNIDNMRRQLRTMGAMFDWRREMVSSDPEYYRWTQWFFIKLFNQGLAYRKMAPVDWCPSCNTTLAREQVHGDDRHCERCETPVTKKNLEQWFFRITNYTEELLKFTEIDWPEIIRNAQIDWIGRSEGAFVKFFTEQEDELEIFTTRPDTLWGATFMVLAPEHPLVDKLTTPPQRELVEAYRIATLRQSDIQREKAEKEKTGVFTGSFAINPVNGELIPIWIADYVLMTYGTGAIMAVPAHDQRDFEFARKFDLPVKIVIRGDNEQITESEMTEALPVMGTMVNSGDLSGTPAELAFQKAVEYVEEKKIGKGAVTYKQRDWLISRQRFWGAPIPIIYCPNCGEVPIPDDHLPLLLPEDVEWKPTGESPLKLHPTWRFTTCPNCGSSAERETDTMDTFMCSSWYHLRYLSPHYDKWPFDLDEYNYWMPVDFYTGGPEHARMHLLYTRFFHKAMRDIGITVGDEPMQKLRNQGMVLGEDHLKMSKRSGNTVAPDELVEKYGADTVRAYLMFFSRWDQGGPWSYSGIEGTSRWMKRVWNVLLEPGPAGKDDPDASRELRRKVHQTLRSVNHDYEEVEFNTIISSLMELLNEMQRVKQLGLWGSPAWNEAVEIYLKMFAPVSPHMSEEIWEIIGKPFSIHTQAWPKVDEDAAKDEEITLVVQVNGKVRDRLTVAASISEEEAKSLAVSSVGAVKALEGRQPRQVIYVKGRLVNIVG
jgi:leucyl-tRNA synthetase